MKPGWYVVDHDHENRVLRGPFRYEETAGAVRQEMERAASDTQNAKWNLWVTEVKDQSDTQRLDWLLTFLSVEDVGDVEYCPGAAVDEDRLVERLTYCGDRNIIDEARGGKPFGAVDWRRLIDAAMTEDAAERD
jgi:hypothetical protein